MKRLQIVSFSRERAALSSKFSSRVVVRFARGAVMITYKSHIRNPVASYTTVTHLRNIHMGGAGLVGRRERTGE